jgi:cation diffusion facilitator family transporter
MTSHIPQIRSVLFTALFFNFVAAVLKTAWGYQTHAVSMEADGLHSFFDATSSIVALIAIWVAGRPPDATHPYGHGKYEALASLCISILLFLACFQVTKESLTRFKQDAVLEVSLVSFVVMLATMGINWAVSRLEMKAGAQYRSGLLLADGRHTESDMLVSLSVIVSLVAGKIGYPMIDPIVGVLIAGVIGKVGVNVLLESSRVLTDSSRIDAAAIEAIVLGIDGVRACHKIRTRGNIGEVYVDLHIHVPPDMTMELAHALAHRAEGAVMQKFTEVVEVVVHLEPDISDLEND